MQTLQEEIFLINYCVGAIANSVAHWVKTPHCGVWVEFHGLISNTDHATVPGRTIGSHRTADCITQGKGGFS